MKNTEYERKRAAMRAYHRRKQWGLNAQGLFVPHLYSAPIERSWWDDVGFINAGYRVIVWWRHPRMVYSDRVDDLAYNTMPDPMPISDLMGELKSQPIYKKRGKSRKGVVAYGWPGLDTASRDWVGRREILRNELLYRSDVVARPSMRVEQLDWAVGINLCVPVEVRNEAELADLAALARRLYLREVSLDALYPGYAYDKDDWARENPRA